MLTYACESHEPAMVKAAVDCLRQHIPDQQKVIQPSQAAISVHGEEMIRHVDAD